MRFRTREELWNETLVPRLSSETATAIEFGVASGDATRWWASNVPSLAEWHGFDTFSGLPDVWSRAGVAVMDAGAFTPSAGTGTTPVIPSAFPIQWHVGLIEDTLPELGPRPEATRLFVLIDVDLKEPTDTVLRWLEEHGEPGDLLYFDEACDPWNEGMSLRESLSRGLRVRALGFTGSALALSLA